ncbi:MAG: hypothetical protein O7A63_10430, partial [Acidobacteria bacterium]|nr:hypothetical protein [Acidobacteriota bacterium]
TVQSRCGDTFLEAFVEGTEPLESCSEVEHFRTTLPYFLQRYEISRHLELRISPDEVIRLVNGGEGDIQLSDDGREILILEVDSVRRVALDISRGERRDLMNGIDGPPADIPSADGNGPGPLDHLFPDGELPLYYGVDGRPAAVIPIKYD